MTTPEEIVAELRGFAEGSNSARATLMRDAADWIERLLDEDPVDQFFRRNAPPPGMRRKLGEPTPDGNGGVFWSVVLVPDEDGEHAAVDEIQTDPKAGAVVPHD